MATNYGELTTEQIALRIEIAKKICRHVEENDPTMNAETRSLYRKYPMWGFYLDGDLPKRIYVVADYEEEKVFTITAEKNRKI